ncbi:MAG: thioredoxin family protein [Eubacteriales bacterium]|nr:thioredoxin family protein [Eubacteriales bacterium]
MGLFGFGKKKEEKEASACCCGAGNGTAEEISCCCGTEETTGCRENVPQSIKVLGAGCKNCHALLESAEAAVKAMGLPASVEFVTDMEKIAEYGVMRLPALVVNERVVAMGKVLSVRDVTKLLEKIGGM